MKYVNKKMVVVINRMVFNITGGMSAQGSNLRPGMGLGFIDNIHANEIFGQKIYPDIFHQAAAYMFFIIMNHVFLDGNKRTGLATAITYLSWNGIEFSPFDEDHVFDFVISIADGVNEPDEKIPEIANWLKTQAV